MNSVHLLLTLFTLSIAPVIEALTAPRHVRGHIVDDAVEVSWEHRNLTSGSSSGYYVIVKDVGSEGNGGRVYMHVDSDTRSARVVGLRPGTTYQLKVAAFTDDTHKTSKSITINTEKLKFLHVQNVKVFDVTNISAKFEWTHVAKNNVHHIKFKLLCVGIQTFFRNGDLMEERTTFQHESWSMSRGREIYNATKLLPNCHYTCRVVSVAGERQSITSLAPQVSFQTATGKPSRPPRPRLSVKMAGRHSTNFSVELYPADNQFGPIDHYKVIAVPVVKEPDKMRTIPYKPVVPLSELMQQALPRKLVTKVVKPLPFVVGYYLEGELPPTLKFTGKWVRKAFKPDTYYSIVVAAFTKPETSTKPLCTLSEPADPPVLIGHDEQREAMSNVTIRFKNTVVATMTSILGIFSLAFLVVFGIKYYQGTKRDAYHFVVNEDTSSSDEETVYAKKPTKDRNLLLKSPNPIPPRLEDESKAEWAVKNMYYNPAFEEMVYRSPDTMQEMEDTMTMIAGNKTGQNADKGYHESALVTVHQPPTDINVPISSKPPLSEQPLTPNVPELSAVSAETTPPPPPPPPTPPQSPMQAISRKKGESGSFHYSSLSCKPGSKNLCSTTTRGRHAPSTPSSSLSPYYYVTLNPAPGASLEEYNITTSASPFTTVHRIRPSASPSTTQRGRRE